MGLIADPRATVIVELSLLSRSNLTTCQMGNCAL
jgi:hypothetical protein